MNRTIRYYLSGIISKSVANSQVFNWGQVLAQKGLRSEFVIFYRNEDEVAHMTRDTTQPVIKIKVVKFFLLFHLQQLFSLIRLYFKARKKYHKIIFQSRTYGAGPSLAILGLFPGVKVIADIRGFEIEQYNTKSMSGRFRLFVSDFYNWFYLHIADKVFCVSSPLVNIISSRYSLRKKEIFSVFGGVADENSFYFSEDLRKDMRREYGLENKVVLLYSGMIDKPWQQPEKYFEFFQAISNIRKDMFLIMLTPNISLADRFRKEYKLNEETILIKESTYADLIKYYNMADFGLLFRKNETVNNVASPTKFSEYSLCGLPVIISAKIGDFSDYIMKTGYGYVVQDNNAYENEINSIVHFISHNATSRATIASTSKELFSKQAQVDRLLTLYKKL